MVVNFRTRDRGISWGARKLTRTFTLIIIKKNWWRTCFWCVLLSWNHSFKTRPGPRPGFQVLTGSPGRPGQFFFFLNQNDVVLVKKQKSMGLQPDLVGSTGPPGQSAGSHQIFSSPVFFFNPARFQPRVGRAGFQNYGWNSLPSSHEAAM
jgi:hypothetical protein